MVVFILMAVGAFLGGFFGGLLGIGGGVILVPFLHFVLKMDMHRAIGTSLALIVSIALVAGIRNYTLGNVNIKIVLIAVGIAAIGALVGTQLSVSLPVVFLRRAFAVLLFAVAVKMFIG